MTKATRVTLTKAQADSAPGRALIEWILAACHDGALDISEVEELHAFLKREASDITAFVFLRALTRDVVGDGALDDTETYHLKKAFERVVPKEVRGIIATHLGDIGVPTVEEDEAEPRWTRDAATSRQIDYIIALGGRVTQGMTKGDAARMIDGLLERRPPTPRQVMLLRFFDHMQLLSSDKDAVSLWVDELYAENPEYEKAWARFKRATNHDPRGQDPSVVPIGAYVNYLRQSASTPQSSATRRAGCLSSLTLLVGSLAACAWLLGKALST